MDTYRIIKELPDANVGTEVIWDDSKNAYYYKKSCYVSPYDRNYLSSAQVTQTPEYFCSINNYYEYYSYNYPVFSRKEIIDLIHECFPDENISGAFNISASKQIHLFYNKLRELGKINIKKTLENK